MKTPNKDQAFSKIVLILIGALIVAICARIVSNPFAKDFQIGSQIIRLLVIGFISYLIISFIRDKLK